MKNKTIVKYSSIHGKGLFCSTKISFDELIGEFECVRAQENDIHVLWIEEGDDGELIPYTVINDMKYANHNSNPNAILYETQLYALKEILPHEEITFHYGEEWD